jgi:hypothetical protein
MGLGMDEIISQSHMVLGMDEIVSQSHMVWNQSGLRLLGSKGG